jgi:hypothetical protein
MTYNSDFYFVQYNGKTKQAYVNYSINFIVCGFMEVSITNV